MRKILPLLTLTLAASTVKADVNSNLSWAIVVQSGDYSKTYEGIGSGQLSVPLPISITDHGWSCTITETATYRYENDTRLSRRLACFNGKSAVDTFVSCSVVKNENRTAILGLFIRVGEVHQKLGFLILNCTSNRHSSGI